MYIEINKDNVIRNPNILNMKTQNEGTTRTTTDQPRKEKERERGRGRKSEQRIIESKYAGRFILFFFSQTVAIYPKAECVLTTDARFQYTIIGYSVRLYVQHSLNYLSPTNRAGEQEENGMQQFNENAYTMHAHRKCHACKK